MKKCLLIISAVLLFTGCTDVSVSDVKDQAMNIMQAEDENVLGIKNAVPSSYSNTTYGEAFDSFFSAPAWKYFVGTEEGADEDGDGQPDYTVNNVEVVEFTGYCEYNEVEVKARIQFTMNKEEGIFEATYLSFNDIPQNYFMLTALLEKVFEEAPDSTLILESENFETSTAVPITENSTELNKTTIKETSAVSESKHIETTAPVQTTIIEPVNVPDFEGEWIDAYSRRCIMNITLNGDVYNIKISWSSSAIENTEWTMSGKYVDYKDSIVYSNCKQTETEYNDGLSDSYTIFSNGTGRIFMSNNSIYWQDDNYENSYGTQFFRSDGELPSFDKPEDFADDISHDYLTGYVSISDGYLNVRSSASSSSSVIGKLYSGDAVDVYDWDGDWCIIDYNGQKGYVHSDYLIF